MKNGMSYYAHPGYTTRPKFARPPANLDPPRNLDKHRESTGPKLYKAQAQVMKAG